MTGEDRVDINMGNVSASFFQSAWTLEMFFKKDANDTNWFVGTSTNGASWQTGWSLQVDGTLKWNYLFSILFARGVRTHKSKFNVFTYYYII